MSIKNRVVFFALVFLVSTVFTATAAKQLRRPLLRWRPVSGATAYQVELKYSRGRIFFKRRTTRTWMYVYLNPGYYYLRVSVVNRFNRIESSSAWTRLVIRSAPWPVLDKLMPKSVALTDQKKVTLTVTGRKFKRSSRLEISGNGRNWRPEKQQVKYSRSRGWYISAEVDATRLLQGEYRIRAVTPVKIFSKDTKSFFVRRGGVAGLSGIELLLGAGWQWPFNPWSDVISSAPLFQAALEYRLSGIRLFSRIPVLNQLKAGFLFQYSDSAEQSGNIAKSTLAQMFFVPYLSYSIPLHEKFSLQIRAGGGWGLFSLTSENSSTLIESNSTDPLVYGGVAVRYHYNWFLFAEAGVDYFHAFMLGEPYNCIQGLIRFGVRL